MYLVRSAIAVKHQLRSHHRDPSKGNHPCESEEDTGPAGDTCPQDNQERGDDTGCGAVDSPSPSSLGREAADEDETGHDQRKERRIKSDTVQHGVPTHPCGHACMGNRRETKVWIGMKDAAYDQSHPVDANEQWSPCPCATGMQHPPHPDCTQESQHTRQDEVAGLDPAEIPKAQQTDRMMSHVEPRAGDHL